MFGLGLQATLNAWAAPAEWQMRELAAMMFTGTAILLLGGEIVGNGAVFAAAYASIGLGLVAALAAGVLADRANPWRRSLAGLAAGLSATGLIGIVVHTQLAGSATGIALIVVGASFAGYGILARNLISAEAAVVTWMLALMMLVDEQIGLTLHVVVIVSSITLLATLGLERYRRRLDDLPIPPALSQLEWALIAAPLVMAAAGVADSLGYGLLLFVEGMLLAGWGAITEIRRRALTGVGAMVVAIILTTVIPVLHGISAGLTGGTWLAAGAVAATVFIIAGSTIERQRHAIGRRLAHIAEILEDWE
jgi:hypothetical protein